MARDYSALSDSVTALLDKARDAPTAVEDDAAALALGAIVKELRDADKRAEAYRVAEKEPHLRAEQAVDQFFFALRDRLPRRKENKQGRPGAVDVLQDRISYWLERKRAAEEAERRRIADEEARKAQA